MHIFHVELIESARTRNGSYGSATMAKDAAAHEGTIPDTAASTRRRIRGQ
jgi:hypothetical protein